MGKIYTPHEAASYLHVRPATIYWLLQTHQIRAFRVGNRWKIPFESLELWMEQQMKKEGDVNG